MEHVAFFIIAGLVFFALLQYSRKLEKDRSNNISKIASSMGFKFEAKPEKGYHTQYSHFQLFSEGHTKKVKNLMFRRSQNSQKTIFGYQYTTSSGKNSTIHRYTVVSIKDPEYVFPDFDLRPEHIFHKIGKVFGYQDINFDTHVGFSKKYLLQGSNEVAIRKLFNPELLNYLEAAEKICVEARDKQIIFYRPYKRLAPEEIDPFYQQAKKCYQVLCQAINRQ
ncbi:hypothetical protein [Aliikangiella sp. IMCC44359]|uniref:hypothetical protein n=1 Tax=Aliikangiella sp. IMCC44359 TaxID=3459125 RepID=UPI00403A7F18